MCNKQLNYYINCRMRFIASVGLSVLIFSQITQQINAQRRNIGIQFGDIRVNSLSQSHQLKKQRSKQQSDSDSDSSNEDFQNLSIYNSFDEQNDNFKEQLNSFSDSLSTRNAQIKQEQPKNNHSVNQLGQIIQIKFNESSLIDPTSDNQLEPIFQEDGQHEKQLINQYVTPISAQQEKIIEDTNDQNLQQFTTTTIIESSTELHQEYTQPKQETMSQHVQMEVAPQQKPQISQLYADQYQQTGNLELNSLQKGQQNIQEFQVQIKQSQNTKRQILRVEQAKDKISTKSNQNLQQKFSAYVPESKIKQQEQKQIQKTKVNVYPCQQDNNEGTISRIYCRLFSIFK